MHLPPIKKRNFTKDLILAFLLLSIAALGLVGFLSIRAREDISQKFIDNAAASAARQFESMVESVTTSIELAGDWGRSGRLALSDTGGMNDLLFPLLKRDRVLFGISVADTLGNSYYLTGHGEGWRTSRVQEAGGRREAVIHYWDANQKQVSEETRPSTYDPRIRPWFSPALASGEVFWTRPYTFFERKAVGFTASLAREIDAGNRKLVIAFDILLDDLFREIQRLAPSENSRIFIFRNDTQLYVPGSEEGGSDFRSILQVDDPVIRKLVVSWEGRHLPMEKAFSLTHDNQVWWCGFRAMDAANRNIWMGVMVPAADMIGGVSQRRTGLWALGGVIVLLAGGLALFLVRRYGRSFNDPGERFDESRPQESIRELVARGEGQTIEFKSTMRMNLHTQKTGKEIEIAWLKAVAAFLNSDGGILLLGVADDGSITGLEADGFANADKCRLHFKNLIRQHIGAEFSGHLRFSLVRVDGKQVGAVTCSRSTEPVYLKTSKSEAFYIRSGPSSEALPASRIVGYVQSRR